MNEVHKKLIDASGGFHGDLMADKIIQGLGFVSRAKKERVFLSEVSGVRAYWVAPGGYIQQSTPTEYKFEVAQDYVGCHLSEYELEDEDDVDLMIKTGYSVIRSEVVKRTIGLLSAAVQSNAQKLWAEPMNFALIAQATEPAGRVLIAGTRAAMAGVPAYPRHANYTQKRVTLDGPLAKGLPNDRVWAVNEDLLSLNLWGMKTKVWDEVDEDWTHWYFRLGFGGAVSGNVLELRTH